MKKQILFSILLSIFLIGCIFSTNYKYTPSTQVSTQSVENEFYEIELRPYCQIDNCGSVQSLMLYVKNKTKKDFEIDWNKTLYIRNGMTFGGFMLKGDIYYTKELAKQNTTDIVFAGQSFTKVISPKKLIHFDKDWYHEELGIGNHGAYIVMIVEGKEVKTKIVFELSNDEGSSLASKAIKKAKKLAE
ncbi:hypothetical protein KKA14_11945 [bacterium]|nr:hypothetical protein [bacterium]